MRWCLSSRADPRAVALADRHYSRKTPGSAQFLPGCRALVLLTAEASALWAVTWPRAEYANHAWRGAPGGWVNNLFRNESAHLSSELIVEAVAASRWRWPDVPAGGIVTFVRPDAIRSTNPGYCFRMAGWTRLRERTAGGLVVYQLLPRDMPPPAPPNGATLRLM